MIYTFFNLKNYKVQCDNTPTKSIKSNSDILNFNFFVENMCDVIFCHYVR